MEIEITEHAFRRYYERVWLMNPTDVIRDLSTPEVIKAARVLGDARVPVILDSKEFEVVIRNGRIVTLQYGKAWKE